MLLSAGESGRVVFDLLNTISLLGTRYPSPAEQVERELRGPVLAAYEDAVGVMDGGQMHYAVPYFPKSAAG